MRKKGHFQMAKVGGRCRPGHLPLRLRQGPEGEALAAAKRRRRPAGTGGVAVLLATNAYVTGQTVNVNGGWYL